MSEEKRIPDSGNLGASEVSAALNLNPWTTPWDLWIEKTNRSHVSIGNEAMSIGNAFEDGVLTLAEEKLGTLVRQPETLYIPDSPIVCHLDARRASDGVPVEAKTAGLVGPLTGTWGDDGSDDIPMHYWIQLCMYAKATKKDIGYLAALLGGYGFRIYCCPISLETADMIVERASKWWDDHVIKDTPPDDSIPSDEMLTRMIRSDVIVDLGEDAAVIADELTQQRRHRLELEKLESLLKRQLTAKLGDAMRGRLPDGRIVGYTQSRRKYFDAVKFKLENPELAERYMAESVVNRMFEPKKET